MSFIIENWYLFAAVLLSSTLLFFPVLTGAGGESGLGLNEAVLKMNRERGVLIDVREPQEFALGKIAQARNVPLAQLEEKLPTLVKNKALPVLFVCAKGVRSARAAKQARTLGYENAHSIAGGMEAWMRGNMPVVAASGAETNSDSAT